jgi:hypothetical protein
MDETNLRDVARQDDIEVEPAGSWLDKFKAKPQDPAAAKPRRRQQREPKDQEDRLIGCPMWWLQRVAIVKSNDHLLVAVYVWRRHIICGGDATFDVPNGELKNLGISRKVKLRTLDLLAAGGLIVFVQRTAKAAPTITILAKEEA